MESKTEIWYRVGLVEVSYGKRPFRWVTGYSLSKDGKIQPWRSKYEACADSRAVGKRASFRW
jgi:hypothetical protein